jgi:hypothetical protein
MPDIEGDARIAHSIYLDRMRERGIPFRREFEEDARSWTRLAIKVRESGFEMATFMEAQFESIVDVRKLTPASLTNKNNFSNAAKRYYRKVPQTSKSGYEEKLRVLLNQFGMYGHRLVPQRYRNRNGMLGDINMPFPAWFRILLADADQDGYREIINCYGELAKEEYETDLGLRALLEEIEGEYDAARFWQCI